MFDDFVQTSRQQRGAGASAAAPSVGFEADDAPSTSALPPITAVETGFVSNDVQDRGASGQPMFQLGRVQYAFSAPLALLTVSSNVLTMCLYNYPSPVRLLQGAPLPAPPKLIQISLDDPERTMEGEVPMTPLPRNRNAPAPDPSLLGPHKMFSNPTGRHLLLTTRNGENFYWTSGWKKAKQLPRLKGLVIESVTWKAAASLSDKRAEQQTILFGTQSGDIYEALLVIPEAVNDEGDFLDRLARRTAGTVGAGNGAEVDKSLHHVFRLSERQPITGLSSQVFMSGSPSRAVVIATTSTRIYEFIGELSPEGTAESMYERLFSPYRSDAIPNLKSELPGDLPYSELHLWTPKGKKNARALAWLTGPGIYHGLIAYNDQQVGDSVIESANLLPYPAIAYEEDDSVAEIPLSVALTEFHFLLLYRDRIMAISSLDDQVMFQENLPLQPHERVIGTAVDSTRGSYWIYTDASIFEVVITQEDRLVWQIYLQRNNYDQALRYTKSPLQRETVLSSQGDQYFRDGRFIQAAQCYAQTFSRTFEEIVLQFLDINERDALRYYLVMRLERLRKEHRTQRMMLATWLVEIYLSKINDLEDVAAAEEASQNVDNYRIEMDMLQDELKQFLITYKDDLDRSTIFNLITKHGRADLLLHFHAVLGEHERIIRHWIRKEEWEKALAAICGQPSLELHYRHATLLLSKIAKQTVDSWIKQDRLSAKRLIPAMSQANDPHQVIRYLQHATRSGGVTDSSVHNLLLLLLAEHDDAGLLAFVTSTSNTNPLTDLPYYDLDYALRTCSDRKKTEACVRIYARMNNFENAVDLAIQAGNVNLACTCADAVQFYHPQAAAAGNNGTATENGATNASLHDKQALRKKLWLKVARFVVEEKNDLAAAMAFLARAPQDLLSIEDILPFFPDFAVIDAFKDDICTALESYAQRIDQLKLEMDEATRSAESIRLDTQRLANRFVSVEADERCGICKEPILQRQFYVFACSHAFHADCLIAETTRHLPPRTLRRILILQEQISQMTGRRVPALPPSYAAEIASVAPMNGATNTALAAVNLLGLDKLRELVLPDAIVGAISASVSVGVASGRKVLAPLDPFADPTASLRAATSPFKLSDQQQSQQPTHEADQIMGRQEEFQERLDEVREELDSLVASACTLCDGSVHAISRPFITDTKELEEWEL